MARRCKPLSTFDWRAFFSLAAQSRAAEGGAVVKNLERVLIYQNSKKYNNGRNRIGYVPCSNELKHLKIHVIKLSGYVLLQEIATRALQKALSSGQHKFT